MVSSNPLRFFPNPGTESYRSSRFEVSAYNASSVYERAFVYSHNEQTTITVPEFITSGDYMEMSWLTFECSGTSQLIISSVSSPISSVNIYPSQYGTPSALSANGTLTIDVGVRQKLWIEINGDRVNPLFIFADRFYETPDPGWTTFVDVTSTPSITGETLYFPPGNTYNVGHLFDLAASSKIFVAGGAVVSGNFTISGKDFISSIGPGVITGTSFSWAYVQSIGNYFDQIYYCTFYGRAPSYFHKGNMVSGLTCVAQPFFFNVAGLYKCEDVKIIAPWHQNQDGFDTEPYNNAAKESLVDNCFSYTGDNNMKVNTWAGNMSATNNLIGNTASENIHLTYWGDVDYGFSSFVINNYVVPNQRYFGNYSNPTEGGHVIHCYVDQVSAYPNRGRFNVTISGLWVEGQGDWYSLFSFKNKLYPWGTQADAWGQISGIRLSNIYTTKVPIWSSQIVGLDASNTPHDMTFTEIYIGGTKLTEGNWDTYVIQNEFPYNITKDPNPQFQSHYIIYVL